MGLLSLSAIPDDPRVRRQGDAFAEAGWRVAAVGLPGAASAPPPWPVAETRVPSRPEPGPALLARRAGNALRRAAVLAAPGLAEAVYWTLDPAHEAFYQAARGLAPDLWLVNDWKALPVARRLVRERPAPIVYDTHELASDEYAERLHWRWLHRPLVLAIEGRGAREAALVTCVSDGIADRLQALYGLRERPLVIRNTPAYRATPFRPTGEAIRVLYHGVVSPGRGLEACIRSVAAWRDEFGLTIRGPAEPGYLEALERCAREAGVADRVALAPPVPMIDLVAEAACFDVGLFALPDHSHHNRHALPNKIFEYAMAGLALCVSDLPEMAGLVRRHGLGRCFGGTEPEGIAEAVNGFDRASIDACKRAALEAARVLNWEHEGAALVGRCEAIAAGRP